jgi:ribonuclease E
MLIDASQSEETRVVVVQGTRLEEFDYDSDVKKQLKGNVYLAKVTRVEPSLQAAFVEYGGNRHGFLAFNEIHPDYYKIPVADREKLIAEEAALHDEDAEDGDIVETVGGDELEDVQRRRTKLRRRYKIQEVIKRGQILLVQVVKEERGNKGAALTTYLSLPGRYCVLMPNTARGGGISRKITNIRDRKRLKTILDSLGIPDGMAVIVRTAGSERTKAEIKRDFDYLVRLWDTIRTDTLQATAPSLIYEEANLIKRAIRDLYTKEIEEILVEGEDGYRVAKDFMRTLMPSHAKRVQQHKNEGKSVLQFYQVESQIDAIHSPDVKLPSGGYIVMNQTEALVAIDVNSGRSTRERHIEGTALKTNLEAADEVARQLRLRDMAGLIVIDFIDMEESRNNQAVERRLKDALRTDRARIQVGRISHFGLLEMSRQRLRSSLAEMSSDLCHYCGGTGFLRSVEWTGQHVLRSIEEEAMRRQADEIVASLPSDAALYVLNQKRAKLASLEADCDVRILIVADNGLVPPNFKITTTGGRQGTRTIDSTDSDDSSDTDRNGRRKRRPRRRRRKTGDEPVAIEAEELAAVETEADAVEVARDVSDTPDSEDGSDSRNRPRKRGRRGGRRRTRKAKPVDGQNADDTAQTGSSEPLDGSEPQPAVTPAVADQSAADASQLRRPRGRQSRRTATAPETAAPPDALDTAEPDTGSDIDASAETADKPAEPRKRVQPARRPRTRRSAAKPEGAADSEQPDIRPDTSGSDTPQPDLAAREKSDQEKERAPIPARESPAMPTERSEENKRTGWWNRVLG